MSEFQEYCVDNNVVHLSVTPTDVQHTDTILDELANIIRMDIEDQLDVWSDY